MNPRDRALIVMFGALLLFFLGMIFAAVNHPAWSHEGSHPLFCVDVDTPDTTPPTQCHDPGTPGADNDDFLHPTCLITAPAPGSAIAQPKAVECLPETGAPASTYALLAAAFLCLAAGYLLVIGRRQSKALLMEDR